MIFSSIPNPDAIAFPLPNDDGRRLKILLVKGSCRATGLRETLCMVPGAGIVPLNHPFVAPTSM